MVRLEVTSRLLDEQIEILQEKLDYDERHLENCEHSTQQAIEGLVLTKRDLQRAQDEKRRLARLELYAANY